jgi:hypothetical protein
MFASRDVYINLLDDVVYNQSMGGPGAATLDKRRPDLRDELGYIAPPNRKLPPVPGSNYNTCDRIKRGTVISKHFCWILRMKFFQRSFSFDHPIQVKNEIF